MDCAESIKGVTDKCFAGFLKGPYREEEDQQPHRQFRHQDKTVYLQCEFRIHRLLIIKDVYEYYLSFLPFQKFTYSKNNL